MKLLPRKMTFQLTPLLDLLLIVIFAQFIEVQDTSSKSDAKFESRAEELREQIRKQAIDYKAKLDAEHAARTAKVRDQFKSILDQQERSGQVLADAFDIPETTVNQLLKIDPNQSKYSPQQTEEIRRALKDLQKENGRELIKLLISYGEMKKKCDIWEIHVLEDGSIEFDNGELVTTVTDRKESKGYEDELFEVYKTFPEPKTLVIILFSYGDAIRGVRTRAQQAIPNLVARMRKDSGQRHWFEFAVLGFTPEGPSLRARNK